MWMLSCREATTHHARNVSRSQASGFDHLIVLMWRIAHTGLRLVDLCAPGSGVLAPGVNLSACRYDWFERSLLALPASRPRLWASYSTFMADAMHAPPKVAGLGEAILLYHTARGNPNRTRHILHPTCQTVLDPPSPKRSPLSDPKSMCKVAFICARARARVSL